MRRRFLVMALRACFLAVSACSPNGCSPASQTDAADVMSDATFDVPDEAAADTGPPLPAQFTVFVGSAQRAVVGAWAGQTRGARVAAVESPAPRDDVAAQRGDGIRVAALADLTSCTECYRLERTSGGFVVRGDGALGLQYGLTHLLEAHGYRFFHPYRVHAPADPAVATVDAAVFDRDFVPEMRLRGIQLHTLHPIEGLSLWLPGEERLAESRAVLDWVVRNRGNFLQVVALDNILTSPEPWRTHMRAVLDDAHLRGLRMGVGIQLFGRNNLQLGFDLLEDPDDPNAREVIRARLRVLLDAMPFDVVTLSFGEFGGVAPDAFVARVNLVREVLAEVAPGVQMNATIHVGNYPDTRVTYMGQEQLYYFLLRYVDPRIVPWVHTVMYYTLYDDAGRAYLHDDFSEHRDYMLARLRNRERVAYYPESAYWVAFDNSIPQYHPAYIRSRHRDLAETRVRTTAQGGDPLQEHVLFSTGWEWGYWQTDAAVLRMGFHLPERWEQTVEDMFAPYGTTGTQAAAQIARLGNAQWDGLIGRRLAPFIAGRDFVIDAGEAMRGIVSQPTRPSFAAIAAMDATARARFTTDVLDPLDAFATVNEEILAAVNAIPADAADPFIAELRDGVAVDAARARFAASVWRAAERFAATGNDGGLLAIATRMVADARIAVQRRHANLHWPDPARLLQRRFNPTLYRFGYLYFADSLCYWERELEQIRAVLERREPAAPGCFVLN